MVDLHVWYMLGISIYIEMVAKGLCFLCKFLDLVYQSSDSLINSTTTIKLHGLAG